MKKFSVKFLREFEVEIQAESAEIASQLAAKVLAQFPKDSCKLLSIIQEGVKTEEADPGPRRPRGGPPNLGGSPGTPVIRQEVLIDQVAKAA